MTHFAKMAVSVVQVLGFEPFSNRFRTFFEHRFHPRTFSNQFRTFFRNPSNYSKGLTHFAKMAVSVVQVLGFEPFSNRFRAFFKHNCRARAPSIQLRQSRPMPGCQSRPISGSFAGYPFVSCGWGGGSNGRRAVPRGPGWPLRSV